MARAGSCQVAKVNIDSEIVVQELGTLLSLCFSSSLCLSHLSLPFLKQIPKTYLKIYIYKLCKLKKKYKKKIDGTIDGPL